MIANNSIHTNPPLCITEAQLDEALRDHRRRPRHRRRSGPGLSRARPGPGLTDGPRSRRPAPRDRGSSHDAGPGRVRGRPGRPVVEAAGIGKVFGAGEHAVDGPRRDRPDDRRRRVRQPDRPVGLRQVDAAPDRRRPHRSRRAGEIRVNGKAARQARLDREYGMVFQAPVLMDWRTIARNVELPLEIMGFPRDERERRSADAAPARRARRLRDEASLAAVGGHAAAGRDRPGAGLRSEAAADGRAVRGARRDDPRADEPRADADLARDRDDGRVRDPLDPGGRLPVDPGRGDERPAGPDQPDRDRRPAPAADRSRRARARATSSS